PLRELWESWWANRPKSLRDPDGMELIRTAVLLEFDEYDGVWDRWNKRSKESKELDAAIRSVWGNERKHWEGRYRCGKEIIEWLLRLHPPSGLADYLLDAIETAFAAVPETERG